MTVSMHSTGKASFDDIYDRPDPSAYCRRMAELDYRIPELARPAFAELIDEYEATTGIVPTVLDLGCSYGVNAAVLRFGTTVAELADHYGGADTATCIARDRARLAADDRLPRVRLIGMDASAPALDYAAATGLLHETVHADLESRDPTESQRRVLGAADLVISTGCVGYVTGSTLTRVARAHGTRLPWMAHFVLRMYAFEPIARELAALGYRTERRPGTFRQRRFASAAEQQQVVNTLSANGIDTTGYESDGWLHAHLYISRPVVDDSAPSEPASTPEDRP
ncbi:class I SAM-dependent methyltransferase [Nocardia sp. NPDC052254]|uniref:class I SAM-dependent methyltransferase n=1 Tax=Nocardia sp. NPDC052254 TaxID=3155681 RepID=UPI00341E61DD